MNRGNCRQRCPLVPADLGRPLVAASSNPAVAATAKGAQAAPALGPRGSRLAPTAGMEQENTLSQYQFLQPDPCPPVLFNKSGMQRKKV